MQNNFEFALILTTIAGFATLIGAFAAFLVKKNSLKALSIGMAFSAGVMIFIALAELLHEAQEYLEPSLSEYSQHVAYACFFGGIILASLIDFFVPAHNEENLCVEEDIVENKSEIKRAGILTAFIISLHSIPESLATFFVASTNLALGIPMALAIAIHNLPLGSAVALPVYHATGKKRLALFYSFLSSLAGPFGAVIGLVCMKTFVMSKTFVGILFGLVAGIMLYISFDTLLPIARKYGGNHQVITGIITGMFFISISLLMLH